MVRVQTHEAEFETMGGLVQEYVTAVEDMSSRDGCSVEVLDWAADHDDKQLIREMIDWLHDCDVDVSGDETGTIADSDVRQMIENGYEGGVKAFMADGLEPFNYARIKVIGPRITLARWESFGFRLMWMPSTDGVDWGVDELEQRSEPERFTSHVKVSQPRTVAEVVDTAVTVDATPHWPAMFRVAAQLAKDGLGKGQGREVVIEMLEYGERLCVAHESHCCYCELSPEACPKHTAEVK